ncbi:peptide methionine sulfoxide reductase MsrA [Pelagophyceae sp. CCMP2097]|nr:peptide methionine sulfoxide reductase MsrA [Pelagophyceae sp. CCMP2097]
MLGLLLMVPAGALLAAGRRAAPARGLARLAHEAGSIASVDWSVKTLDGTPLPAIADVFDQGAVKFVLGGGGFLKDLHNIVADLGVGEQATRTVGSGFERDARMGPVDVPIDMAPEGLEVGMVVDLSSGQRAVVTKVTLESVTIDANHALAGVQLVIDAKLTALEPPLNANVGTAVFGLGCFWGAELAFQRLPGVLGTKVGYCQGSKLDPNYEEVCSGTTGHTEAVHVTFDTTAVTFETLLDTFWERLGDSAFLKDQVGNDRGTQYRHGIYYQNASQGADAEASVDAYQSTNPASPIFTEVEAASTFYDAEDHHQQYLQKGGQSAKKQASEEIRCYG